MTKEAETNHAISNAHSWADSILEMVTKYRDANEAEDDEALSEAEREMDESILSCEVRADWHTAGGESELSEYRLLLTWGGPALQLTGTLGDWNQPDSARLEWQDWGTPWTPVRDLTDEQDEALLEFAQRFYYGEG